MIPFIAMVDIIFSVVLIPTVQASRRSARSGGARFVQCQLTVRGLAPAVIADAQDSLRDEPLLPVAVFLYLLGADKRTANIHDD